MFLNLAILVYGADRDEHRGGDYLTGIGADRQLLDWRVLAVVGVVSAPLLLPLRGVPSPRSGGRRRRPLPASGRSR